MAGLMRAADGWEFAYVDAEEARFLYEEIVTRRCYLREGIALPTDARDGAIIDVGANIGLFAMQCSRERPDVEVHAIEPAPAVYEVLARNAAALPNLQTHCVAVRSPADVAAGTATLHYYPGMPGESTFHAEESAAQQAVLGRRAHAAVPVPCRAVTLSTLMRTEQLARVALLKVDVEGDELGVLESVTSADDWARIAQVVVEVHDVDGRKDAAVALLQARGFSVVVRAVTSEVVDGYETVVPAELRLFLLYARRTP